jgi:DNA replication factor GINS
LLRSQDIEKVHTVSFALEDVKATLHYDLNLNVSGVKIEGKEGDILNIPRWVAQILESQGHITMDDTDMVVELKQSIVKENVQGDFELSTLDPYFYIKLKSYMKKLNRHDYDKVESMLNTLVRKRHGKIINLADSSRLTGDIAKKLTVEEHEFYNNLHNICNSFTKSILGDKK